MEEREAIAKLKATTDYRYSHYAYTNDTGKAFDMAIKALEEQASEKRKSEKSMRIEAKKLIEEHPTAYDVDKVVTELYDLPFEHGAAIRARVVDVFDDPVETKDLCPDCLEELRDFLDGAQLNDPFEERQIGFKTQADPYNHLMKRFTRKE